MSERSPRARLGLDAIAARELIAERLSGGRAVLGICVGMQVLFERGVEHGVETAGFGTWPGVVEQLEASVLPHMGWNTVSPPRSRSSSRASSQSGSTSCTRTAFATGRRIRPNEPDQPAGAASLRLSLFSRWSVHDSPFIAAVEDGRLSATQFHPEKSGHAGQVLLRNWIATL